MSRVGLGVLSTSGLPAIGSIAQPLARAAIAPPAPDRIEGLAALITKTSRDNAIEAVIGEYRKGATITEILGGTLLAGVREVNPRPVGYKLHAIMVVGSCFSLSDATPGPRKLLPALYNVDDFKRSQENDEFLGDWTQTPPPAVSFSTEKEARAAFHRAMRDWDDKAADRAVTGLYPFHDIDGIFEIIWPYAARCMGSIGHKIIYAAQAHRALSRIGKPYGLPVVRSLVNSLLAGGGPGPNTRPDELNRKAMRELKGDWKQGRDDPEASAKLLTAFRETSPEEAAAACIETLNQGVGSRSVWDGLRLFASEILMRAPGLLAVHPVTATNAMHIASMATRDDATRRLTLLNCSSWLAMYRDYFRARKDTDMSMKGPGIDALTPAPGRAPAAIAWMKGDSEPTAVRREVLTLASDSAKFPKIKASLRDVLYRKGFEHHEYKYAAAILEDIGHTHPEWAPRLLAAGVPYLPCEERDEVFVYQTAQRIFAGEKKKG